jgi:hypothetical protein
LGVCGFLSMSITLASNHAYFCNTKTIIKITAKGAEIEASTACQRLRNIKRGVGDKTYR